MNLCKNDNDCKSDEYCSFHEEYKVHTCISNNPSDIYLGCYEKSKIPYDYIESNSIEDHSNIKNCIDFSRKQTTPSNIHYNHMIYKPKKNISVDLSQIQIRIKSNQKTIMNIPYSDYFEIECDEKKEICKLTAKSSFFSFIEMNNPDKLDDLYIEILYSCYNEGIVQTIKEFLKNKSQIIIQLKCPIESNDSKCISLYIPNKSVSELEKEKDMNKPSYDCNHPLYKIPRIVNNIDVYQEQKEYEKKEELESYEEEIMNLKIQKKIKEMELHNQNITYEEASELIKNGEIENKKSSWKRYTNKDAVYPFLKDTKEIHGIEYYGMVYSIEDALRIANEKNENFFVWYHNTYSIKRFSSRLYFIHKDKFIPSSVDITNPLNWIQHENVTTCVLEVENYSNNIMSSIFQETLENNEIIKDNIMNIWSEGTDEDMNTILSNLNKNFDSKIVTMGQSIQMNDYETDVHNKLLSYIYVILFLVFICFVFVLTYYYFVSKGTVSFFKA